MEIKILYEDEYVLALDKPSGLMVHSDGRTKEETLVDWLNKNYPNLKEVGEEQILQNGQKIKRPGIVHRLDKETSGVILVAKTQEAFLFFKNQFKNHLVEKVYNAVVWGVFKEKEGIINKTIGRSASDFRKWSAEYGAKGELREAITEYKVLAQSSKDGHLQNAPVLEGAHQGALGFSYLEIKPKTGRTHQIRVHLKSIGHPVVGDKLYGRNNPPSPPYIKGGIEEKCLGFNRLALHAVSIKLELPNGIHIKIESPLPKEFEEIKNILK